LTSEEVFEQLHTFSKLSSGWIPSEVTPSFAGVVDKLRKRGVCGPLWSYFAMAQRLWPQSNN